MNRWSCLLAPALVVVAISTTGCGSDSGSSAATTVSAVTVADAWARTSPAMVTTGAAYVTVTSPVDDRLVSATVDASIAGSVELHETMLSETGDTDATGMTAEPAMEMQAANGIDLQAGQPLVMAPGGYHLMMMDLAAPLTAGQTFTMTLTFQKAGTRDVTVTVRDDAP